MLLIICFLSFLKMCKCLNQGHCTSKLIIGSLTHELTDRQTVLKDKKVSQTQTRQPQHFLIFRKETWMLCITEETDMRSGRQISDVFSNKYKFIDEEKV